MNNTHVRTHVYTHVCTHVEAHRQPSQHAYARSSHMHVTSMCVRVCTLDGWVFAGRTRRAAHRGVHVCACTPVCVCVCVFVFVCVRARLCTRVCARECVSVGYAGCVFAGLCRIPVSGCRHFQEGRSLPERWLAHTQYTHAPMHVCASTHARTHVSTHTQTRARTHACTHTRAARIGSP